MGTLILYCISVFIVGMVIEYWTGCGVHSWQWWIIMILYAIWFELQTNKKGDSK